MSFLAMLVLAGCSLVRAPGPVANTSDTVGSSEGANAGASPAVSRGAVGVDPGTVIARTAAQLIGAPYQFGGADVQGFDCSGLAVYAHERVGLQIPRTAEEQRRAAHPVALQALEPGDLVFFRIRHHLGGRRVDHVGIYAGDGKFIHAPRSGGVVSYADLHDGYYRKHLAGAGRFWSDSQRFPGSQAGAASPH
jgi:cell wall-associated NlpC family hydrolase